MKKIVICIAVVALLIVILGGYEAHKTNSEKVIEYYEPESLTGENESRPTEAELNEEASALEVSGIITYDLNKEISSRLNLPKFDAALVKYLQEEKLLPMGMAGDHGSFSNILTVSDDGFLTIDLESGAFQFDLRCAGKERQIIRCTVADDGFVFEKQ